MDSVALVFRRWVDSNEIESSGDGVCYGQERRKLIK